MTAAEAEVRGCRDIKELCGDFSDDEYGFHCRLAELYESWKADKKHESASNIEQGERIVRPIATGSGKRTPIKAASRVLA